MADDERLGEHRYYCKTVPAEAYPGEKNIPVEMFGFYPMPVV